MPEPKPPSVSPFESTADAGMRATPTRVADCSSPAKAKDAGRRHKRISAARIFLQRNAERQEELPRRRRVEYQDAARGIVRREHAVVEIRGIAQVGQVGDVKRQFRAAQPAKGAEVVTETKVEGGVDIEALVVGVCIVALAGELALQRCPEAVLPHG